MTHYVQILIKSYNHTKYNHCQTDFAKNIDLTESDAYRIKGYKMTVILASKKINNNTFFFHFFIEVDTFRLKF